MTERRHPVIWFVAAGYKLPAGIEAYLLHYATELRRHGFNTELVVFERLPRVEHRYLRALRERGIPIRSLYAASAWRAWCKTLISFVPWWLTVRPRAARRVGLRDLLTWQRKRCAVQLLRRWLTAEAPDLIHVKGRIIAEAWPVFPSERTVYQHALMGTVDPSWTGPEVEAFRRFASRIARIFAQGRGVADTLAREYGIPRRIDSVFTMAPDEIGADRVDYFRQGPVRFGILCRFTEQKGIQYILDALLALRERHGPTTFVFAGQGPLQQLIESFVSEHALTEVRVAAVDTPAKTFADFDVLVHPGLDDAMPVSIVEGLMCGRPCIGTRVGGVPDLIRDGHEGLLIDPASSGQIAEAMDRFLAMSDEDVVAFQRRARARYEEVCRPEVVGAIVAEHYRAVLKEAAEDAGSAEDRNDR